MKTNIIGKVCFSDEEYAYEIVKGLVQGYMDSDTIRA